MKKLILLICMLAGMSSCYHEDALIVPEQPDKYNILTDDPSDPTQHVKPAYQAKNLGYILRDDCDVKKLIPRVDFDNNLSEISDCDYNQSD